MEPNPLDELNSQLPGRLIAVEVLLVLLLRKKADAASIMRNADEIVMTLEAAEMRHAAGEHRDYALKIFNAARESLESLTQRVRPPR